MECINPDKITKKTAIDVNLCSAPTFIQLRSLPNLFQYTVVLSSRLSHEYSPVRVRNTSYPILTNCYVASKFCFHSSPRAY